VWQIDGKYILKKHGGEEEAAKVLSVNRFLKKENIPVAEYIKTVSGGYYTVGNGGIYSLTYKINGEHIEFTNPFAGDYLSVARNIGTEIARLHKALKKSDDIPGVYDCDFISELNGSLSEIAAHNIGIPGGIVGLCLEFCDEYRLLPRQLIHRDIQFENMLFKNGGLTSFLDFDCCEINARLFDVAYFGQSVLFNNYKDSISAACWIGFFNSFLEGYNSENALDKNEIKAIYKMCAALQINFISFYLWIESEEKRKLVPNRVDMARWIYDNEQIFAF
jgi:Ser/Thr protein kinase RdoA (MazF antagonist)